MLLIELRIDLLIRGWLNLLKKKREPKSKSIQQFLKEKYGNKIPKNVPDSELDKFVKRAYDKANIKDLGKSINES